MNNSKKDNSDKPEYVYFRNPRDTENGRRSDYNVICDGGDTCGCDQFCRYKGDENEPYRY